MGYSLRIFVYGCNTHRFWFYFCLIFQHVLEVCVQFFFACRPRDLSSNPPWGKLVKKVALGRFLIWDISRIGLRSLVNWVSSFLGKWGKHEFWPSNKLCSSHLLVVIHNQCHQRDWEIEWTSVFKLFDINLAHKTGK